MRSKFAAIGMLIAAVMPGSVNIAGAGPAMSCKKFADFVYSSRRASSGSMIGMPSRIG